MRQQWIGLLILMFAFSSGLYASHKPGVYHVVICWLKEPNNAVKRQELIDASRAFETIPGILSVSVGNMIPSERKIVDSSYDVGIIMAFENQDAMQAYLQNPLHKKATKEVLIPLTSKVIIYDFAVQ